MLGYWEWLEGLQRGFAAHHAGMLPTFKEVVEELFTDGLVKAVFATETLALGINMPARSVVLEKLVKWNGETHADVTPGEYTQLTGRAGRRGIDVEGHAVVLWQPGMDPRQRRRPRLDPHLPAAVELPARRTTWPSTWSARSAASRPGRCWRARSRSSRPTRRSSGWPARSRRNLEALEGYREAMTCHLGDAQEYGRLRAELKRREGDLARSGAASRRAEAAAVARAAQARRRHPRADRPAAGPGRRARPRRRRARRRAPARAHRGPLGRAGCRSPTSRRPSSRSGRLRVPKGFNHRVAGQTAATWPRALRELDVPGPGRAGARRSAAADDDQLAALRAALRRHPVHGCDDREAHMRWAERWHRLRGETDALERRVAGKTSSIARTFDRVCVVLDALGYLDGDEVADGGRVAGAGLQRVRPARRWRACARGCGTRCRRPSSPPSCRRSSTRAAAPTSRTRVVPSGPVQTALHRDGPAVGAARRARARQRRAVPQAARPRLRLGDLALGVRAPGSSRCSTTTPT